MPAPARLFALVASLVLGLSGAVRAAEVTVFAAASLKTALDQVATAFAANGDHRATIAYAGSSALARQIQLGAPADVFISANSDWMDVLQADGIVDPANRFDLAGGRLVLVAHGAGRDPVTLADLPDLLGDGRLAMGFVNAVPAGIYGKQALQSLGLWNALAGRIAETDNVRAALVLVALGEAPYGITYATDAHASDQVSIVASFPPDSHAAITYPVAAIGDATPAARAFLEFLRGPKARAILAGQGFTPLVAP
ncbi:MAG TPA: molybdate ABC transporter substrate-binding protein [Aliiroseovarius sp.]|nr:molybdate ABC transporter substrate-binding protein [Aliiroseovarius sp.]